MTGQVVFGEDYFSRPKDEERVWRRLKRGGHLLVLAPRRVGKTSLLRHLENNPREGFVFLYVMVQSCNTEHQFYKEILEKLYSSEFTDRLDTLSHKGKEWISSIFHNIKGIEFGEAGISFQNSDYKLTAADLEKVINNLKLNQKLILVLDEYPDVLEKISNLESKQAAIDFLATTRSLCQNTELSKKIQFIFTGSIGLDTLAHRLGSTSLINDKDKVAIDPLSQDNALAFIDFLAHKNDSRLSPDKAIAIYLLQKVDWLMPYYIEALWERLEDLCCDNDIENPTQDNVDKAFELLFHNNYRTTFNHWAERLQRFEKDEAKLAKTILDKLTEADELSLNEIYNIFQDENHQHLNGNYILDCLEHDGYIFEHKEKAFKFTSPILKEWWRRYADRTL
ncbi:MAG: AAA family ATPase [Methylobacter tundripaludum]|nr:AAA family ATPase [Methylobacter tundripaludum]